MPWLLRLEGLPVAGGAVSTYHRFDQIWWLFVVLILLPDISMLGYLRNPRLGAWCYNFAHTYVVPLALFPIGWVFHWHYLFTVALIWIAHIGFDRALGYGLKRDTGFKDTHLGQIGRSQVG